MNPELQELRDALIEHIQSVGGSLHTQMQEMEDRILARFDAQSARLDRQGGLLRGGGVQITRLVEWSEKIDGIIDRQQAEINELKRRLDEKGAS